MNTFKRKSLYAALAGVSALGATGAADAVNVNPDGLGQVLLYPYYTVRNDSRGNAYLTLLSVVNTTGSVKAVKVRFLEGKMSNEVLDFNLYLSPYDVWTAAIVPTAAAGKVVTVDNSCTSPLLPTAGQEFVNFQYYNDAAGASLDRSREGYFEILEMGVVTNTTVAGWATHNSGTGIPANCPAIRTNDGGGWGGSPGSIFTSPTGGLIGGESLVNINSGTDYTADPVALDSFRTGGGNLLQWSLPGSIQPNLQNSSPKVSVVFYNPPGSQYVVSSNWTGSLLGADPVSAVLMHDAIFNEIVLDSGTASGTDWVVTFPTKRFYYQYVDSSVSHAEALFQRNFTSIGACDDVDLNLYDREERTAISSFSPPPPGLGSALCWEANVVTFNGSNVLGSINNANVTTSGIAGFQNGWLRLGFSSGVLGPDGAGGYTLLPYVTTSAHQLVQTTVAGWGVNTTVFNAGTGAAALVNSTATYFGLPSIGFSVNSYFNGNIGGVLSAYGGNFIHKQSRRIGTILP